MIAELLSENIWFVWWWNTSVDNLNSDKLWLNDWDLNNLKEKISESYPDFDMDNFYYFAEL